MLQRLIILSLFALLPACASVPGIPDVRNLVASSSPTPLPAASPVAKAPVELSSELDCMADCLADETCEACAEMCLR